MRQLYTDQDEVLFDAARPVILNGIEDIVTRPDLADRAILLMLEPILEERRRPERELWAAFEEERPRILDVLLDAEALHHRGVGKAQKIRMRLGGSPNMFEEFPDKPKGMHWRTYDRLRRMHDVAEGRSASALMRVVERLERRDGAGCARRADERVQLPAAS